MSKIVTVADLNTYSGSKTTDDALAQQTVDAVNAYVESYTHRVWGETKTFTERADFGRNIWPSRQDIVSVDTVDLGYPGKTPTSLTLNDDYWLSDAGMITFLGYYATNYMGFSPSNYVSITYTCGKTDVPADLKLAALSIAYDMYQDAVAGGKSVSEVQVGSYRVRYSNDKSSPNGQDESTKSSFDVLDRYRQRRA